MGQASWCHLSLSGRLCRHRNCAWHSAHALQIFCFSPASSCPKNSHFFQSRDLGSFENPLLLKTLKEHPTPGHSPWAFLSSSVTQLHLLVAKSYNMWSELSIRPHSAV